MNRAACLVVLAMSLLFGLAVAFVACSSSNDGSGTVAYSLLYCPNAETLVTTTCTSCVESNCSDDVTAANSGCAPYLQCACAPGSDAAACPYGPLVVTGPDGGTNACLGDTTGLLTCEVAHCFAQCNDAGL
jgi:hypothetical protein